MFAEVEISRYSKTKKTRIVPLIKSLPYLKAWLSQHSQGSNPKAYLFVSLENSAKYQMHRSKLAHYIAFTRIYAGTIL
jgi:hypothetical protein